MVPSSLALLVDFIVLTLVVLVWRNPETRPFLKRQSLWMVIAIQFVDIFNNFTYMYVLIACLAALYITYLLLHHVNRASYAITNSTKWCAHVVGLSVSFGNSFFIYFK